MPESRFNDDSHDLLNGGISGQHLKNSHFIQFYDAEPELAHAVGGFAASGLAQEGAAIIIATPPRNHLAIGADHAPAIGSTRTLQHVCDEHALLIL